jgi:ppGpp synthetase/RelA/SpoT-type nucleotidyltranferase
MQDIAGCRIVVADVPQQDAMVDAIRESFDTITVIDRREYPSHGYRAVHLVVTIDGSPVEIQVRTELQQHWAQVSEIVSELVDKRLKYGEGPTELLSVLETTSRVVAVLEGPLPGSLNREELISGVLTDFQIFLTDLEKFRR